MALFPYILYGFISFIDPSLGSGQDFFSSLGERTFALLESLNAGVPVGVIRSKDGLFHSSIPPGASSDRSLNIDSLKAFKSLIKIAIRRRASELIPERPILETSSRNLALEVFGLR